MSLSDVTDEMIELLEEVLCDVPKAIKGNKTAAQRIRAKTIELTKVTKLWRRLSIDSEKGESRRDTSKKRTLRKAGSQKKS